MFVAPKKIRADDAFCPQTPYMNKVWPAERRQRNLRGGSWFCIKGGFTKKNVVLWRIRGPFSLINGLQTSPPHGTDHTPVPTLGAQKEGGGCHSDTGFCGQVDPPEKRMNTCLPTRYATASVR